MKHVSRYVASGAGTRLTAIRRWVGDSRCWTRGFLEALPRAVVCVVAMGSAVRDRGHRRSDFDLLVLYRGRRPAISAPMEVDVRTHAVESAEEQLRTGHEVLGWAMRFGVVLYDPKGIWGSLSRKIGGKVPLPSAGDASRRAEASLAKAREMLAVGDESAADDLVLAGITQLARERLIRNQVYPASRPELPGQLRSIAPKDHLAQILNDAMYAEVSAATLLQRIDAVLETA